MCIPFARDNFPLVAEGFENTTANLNLWRYRGVFVLKTWHFPEFMDNILPLGVIFSILIINKLYNLLLVIYSKWIVMQEINCDWKKKFPKNPLNVVFFIEIKKWVLNIGHRREGTSGRHEPPPCRHEPCRFSRQIEPPLYSKAY